MPIMCLAVDKALITIFDFYFVSLAKALILYIEDSIFPKEYYFLVIIVQLFKKRSGNKDSYFRNIFLLSLSLEVLIKDPDGVSNKSDTGNIHGIIGQIVTNNHSEYLHKHLKPNVCQDSNALPRI